MFIGAHEAEYMFVTTLLKIEQHLLAQGRCPYKLFSIPHRLRHKSRHAQQIGTGLIGSPTHQAVGQAASGIDAASQSP